MPRRATSTGNEAWRMDFVSYSLANGRHLKCPTVADDFSHECADITVDYGISGEYAIRLLDRETIAIRRRDYNVVRPPARFAGQHRRHVGGAAHQTPAASEIT